MTENTHMQMIQNMKTGESECLAVEALAKFHGTTVEQVGIDWANSISNGLCTFALVHGETCLVRK